MSQPLNLLLINMNCKNLAGSDFYTLGLNHDHQLLQFQFLMSTICSETKTAFI